MKVITANLNGIRSAADKGFMEWAAGQRADFIAVQETKAQADIIDGRFDVVGASLPEHERLHGVFAHAQKKGYSGVGLYSRHVPNEVRVGMGVAEFDAEGRWVEMRFEQCPGGMAGGRPLSVVSAYFPSGSSGEDRQAAKFRFLECVAPLLQAMVREREVLLLGDVNIAHQEIDLKNWKGNLKNSGFLPEERSWMSWLLEPTGPVGMVDVYRRLHPSATDECYTWWSARGQARANNVGWRIDYQLATPGLGSCACQAEVYKAQRFSDHAPLVVEYT